MACSPTRSRYVPITIDWLQLSTPAEMLKIWLLVSVLRLWPPGQRWEFVDGGGSYCV